MNQVERILRTIENEPDRFNRLRMVAVVRELERSLRTLRRGER